MKQFCIYLISIVPLVWSMSSIYADVLFTDINMIHKEPNSLNNHCFTLADYATAEEIIMNSAFISVKDVIWFNYLPKPYVWDLSWGKVKGIIPHSGNGRLRIVDDAEHSLLELCYTSSSDLCKVYFKSENEMEYFKLPLVSWNIQKAAVFSYYNDCSCIINSVRYADFLEKAKFKIHFVKAAIYDSLFGGVKNGKEYLDMSNESHNYFFEQYIKKMSEIYFKLHMVECSWNIVSPKYVSKPTLSEIDMRKTYDELTAIFNEFTDLVQSRSTVKTIFLSEKLDSVAEDIDNLASYLNSDDNPTKEIFVHPKCVENGSPTGHLDTDNLTELKVILYALVQSLNKGIRIFEPMLDIFLYELRNYNQGVLYNCYPRANFVSNFFTLIVYQDFLNDLRCSSVASIEDIQSFIDADIISDKIKDLARSVIDQKNWKYYNIDRSDNLLSKTLISSTKENSLMQELTDMKLQSLCIKELKNRLSTKRQHDKTFRFKSIQPSQNSCELSSETRN